MDAVSTQPGTSIDCGVKGVRSDAMGVASMITSRLVRSRSGVQ
jgi:hypothetical protein